MAYRYDPDDEDQFFYDNQGIFSPDLLRMGPAFPLEDVKTEKNIDLWKDQKTAIDNTLGGLEGKARQTSSIYKATKPNYGTAPFDMLQWGKSWDIASEKYDYYQQLKQLRRDSEIDEVPDIAPAGEDNFADIGRPNLNTAEIAAQAEGPMDIPILQPEGPSIDDVAEQTFKTTNIEMPQSLPTKPLLDKPEWDAKGGGMGKVQAAGAVAQLAAGGIGMLDKTEEVDAPNYIAGILGSAGQGASMGAMFGPWGAAIGGVLGAGAGLVKTISQDKATNARISQREEQERRFLQARSTTQTNPLYAEKGLKVKTPPKGKKGEELWKGTKEKIYYDEDLYNKQLTSTLDSLALASYTDSGTDWNTRFYGFPNKYIWGEYTGHKPAVSGKFYGGLEIKGKNMVLHEDIKPNPSGSYDYPQEWPIYKEHPGYIPFTQKGDTLSMSQDLQGTGVENAIKRGWAINYKNGGKISYINQLQDLI